MGIEMQTLGENTKNRMVGDVFGNITEREKPLPQKQLAAFKHVPQSVFLIDQDMNVLEINDHGRLAVKNAWVGVTANKLHFNSKENDRYVRKTIAHLGHSTDGTLFERFALRGFDMTCRSFTVSCLSPMSSEFILTIQGDLSCTKHKMESISRAFSLTASEANIVQMMVAGLKPKEIAYEVGISLNTVRSHLRTLYAKMQARSYNDVLTQTIRLLV